MRPTAAQFENRKKQILKVLERGPLTYDQLYKTIGFDPNNYIRSMIKDGKLRSRREKVGQNGNFHKYVYYVEEVPETPAEDVNGFSDRLRVLMGYMPIQEVSIEGPAMFFDDVDYYQKHREEIRRQAPCVGEVRHGSIQSHSSDLEMYGAA